MRLQSAPSGSPGSFALDRLSKIYLITYPAGVSSGSSSLRTLQVSNVDQRQRKGKGTKLTQVQVNELLKAADTRARAAMVVSKDRAPTTDSKLLSTQTALVDQPVIVQIAWYWYDPYNRRVCKLTETESTFFAYDGWQCTDEFYADFSDKKTFFASDRLDEHLGYAIYSGGNWVRFGIIQDHLGSVVRVTDDGGSVVERYEYDSYGKVTVYDSGNTPIPQSQASVQNFLGYAGHGLDLESGLVYMRNRYYLPELGRFLTQDPIGIWSDKENQGGGFGYVGANPSSRVDMLGLETWVIVFEGDAFASDPDDISRARSLARHDPDGGGVVYVNSDGSTRVELLGKLKPGDRFRASEELRKLYANLEGIVNIVVMIPHGTPIPQGATGKCKGARNSIDDPRTAEGEPGVEMAAEGNAVVLSRRSYHGVRRAIREHDRLQAEKVRSEGTKEPELGEAWPYQIVCEACYLGLGAAPGYEDENAATFLGPLFEIKTYGYAGIIRVGPLAGLPKSDEEGKVDAPLVPVYNPFPR